MFEFFFLLCVWVGFVLPVLVAIGFILMLFIIMSACFFGTPIFIWRGLAARR